MNPKAKVNIKYPAAKVEYSYVQKEYVVYLEVGKSRNRHILGCGASPELAWQCAARRIN